MDNAGASVTIARERREMMKKKWTRGAQNSFSADENVNNCELHYSVLTHDVCLVA